MSILGGASVIPVAIPALAQATDSSARTKARTKTPLKRKAPPSLPTVSDTYVPPPAGETNLDLAKKHFRAGRKAYEKGEYGTALDEFQKSYNLIRILDTQYNIGLCYEKLGVYDKAIAAVQLYLEGKPGKEEREEAEARIAWIRSQIKQQKKEEPPGQAVAAVAPPQEEAPPLNPVQVADTRVAVRRKPKGRVRVPSNATWKMPPQEEAPVSPPKVAAIPPPVEKKGTAPILSAPTLPATDTYIPPADSSNATIGVTQKSDQPAIPYRTLMWTSVGLSAAGLGTGIVAMIAAKNKKEEHDDLINDLEQRGMIKRDSNGTGYFDSEAAEAQHDPALRELKDEEKTREMIAIAGFASAAVLVGVGGLFYWLDNKKVTVSAVPTIKGSQVYLSVEF